MEWVVVEGMEWEVVEEGMEWVEVEGMDWEVVVVMEEVSME